MHYPWWYVPQATAPMLIALISVVHVLVSHYAVGGGLFLAVETGFAYRTGDRSYLEYLRRHARFFILLTVVFGAITGVGIWWTIGLASPLATEVLIRTFVFGWAMEYVFFVIELVAAFIFYYYWGRLKPKMHVTMAWIYAFAAWMSLVLITGITAFMLHPGAWLAERNNFWIAFLNPQCIPQIIARTGGALMLTSLYVYVHSSLMRDTRLHDLIQRRSTRPALLGAILITVGGAGWLLFLPESAKAVLTSAAVLNVFVAQLFAMTVVVFVLLYIGPYRNPGSLSPVAAMALMILGVAAFSVGEFVRESVRKPYVIYNVVLGNQILPEEVQPLRQTGYLQGGVWTRAYVQAKYPQAVSQGQIDRQALLHLPAADRVKLGSLIFQYHCNDCHAIEQGYSAVGPLLRGHTRPMILHMIEHLEKAHFFMPPWAGTPEEAELLADYLETVAPARPQGMAPGT
jgi:cytochrome bd-type quinol oxidase subunit 1/mono/diheme cytochrome c family protein